MMAKLATGGFIVLPGGFGTFEEVWMLSSSLSASIVLVLTQLSSRRPWK